MDIGISYILDEPFDDTGPKPADMCGCSNCGWKGKCSDCETDWEQEGWENPSYQIHLCPNCEDGGCIDDYWYSKGIISGNTINFFENGQPCDHPNCGCDIEHACEICNRIGAKGRFIFLS